jgi:phosphopantothenoylcysteine decarboxylase / phosphopantothenate---cysteine ligase
VPAGVDVVRVSTAAELHEAVREAAGHADVVVMSAAVADYRPVSAAQTKVKKSDGPPPVVELERTVDVLRELVASRGSAARPILVGFAAETGDAEGSVLDHGRAKLRSKGCDAIVVNDVSGDRVFGRPDNAAVILRRDGSERVVDRGPKEELADAVWDEVAILLASTERGSATTAH